MNWVENLTVILIWLPVVAASVTAAVLGAAWGARQVSKLREWFRNRNV